MPDDPRQMTSTEMRTEAEELERVAKSYMARAKQLREVAALVDGLAKHQVIESHTALRPAFPGPLHDTPPSKSSRLTSNSESTILPDVIANSSGKLARGISRSRSKKHPFVRALYENPDPKKRMTVTDWAKENKYKPGTVATWVKNPKSDGARRIPREAVEKIREQFGLGDEVWAVGITEPE